MKRLGLLCLPAAVFALFALPGCHRPAVQNKTQESSDATNQAPSAPEISSPKPEHTSTVLSRTHSRITAGDVPILEQINRETTRVVAASATSLVRVISQVQVDPHAQLLGLPFRFPGLPHGVKTMVPSYGSGVIISADGYLVTNYHVVHDAKEVQVQLHDGRMLAANVVASDRESDLAVLKVAATDLPALPWGDSDKVQVGESVFALGNPFNLDTSVSRGIISGIGRNLPEPLDVPSAGESRAIYQDYLQTDAAINVGNSGGALINIHGELIGINAAIASFTQGSEGVGFAIPSNLVRATAEQLIEHGHLIRGYLGVRLPTHIDDGVAELLGLEPSRGALLAGVQRRSPAEAAKLRAVDCIVQIDGHRIDSLPQLRLIVAQIPVGKEVVVTYIRSGATRRASVKIEETPKEPEASAQRPLDEGVAGGPYGPQPPQTSPVLGGVQVTDLTQKSRLEFGVPDFVISGVVVTSVAHDSVAEVRGLARGDVIEMACAQRAVLITVAKPADFAALSKNLKVDQPVAILVHHGRMTGSEDRTSNFIYLAPGEK